MRKTIVFIVALFLVFAMVACGSSDEQTSDTQQAETEKTEEEPFVPDELQELFYDVGKISTVDDLNQLLEGKDFYINETGTWAKAYSVGYEYQATTERTRDREGPCIDFYFTEEGNFSYAEYGIYNDPDSGYVGRLKYETGKYKTGEDAFDDPEEAFKAFFAIKEEYKK